MKTFKKILFFADGSPGERGALIQAIALAEHNTATLTVMDVVTKVGTKATDWQVKRSIRIIQRNLIKARQKALDKLIADVGVDQEKTRVVSLVIPGKDVEVLKLIKDKKYNDANREKRATYHKEYRKANKEKLAEYDKNRKVKKA